MLIKHVLNGGLFDTSMLESLRTALQSELPGLAAQSKMAPMMRLEGMKKMKVPADAKLSAVLMMLYPGENGLHMPLILRNDYNRSF